MKRCALCGEQRPDGFWKPVRSGAQVLNAEAHELEERVGENLAMILEEQLQCRTEFMFGDIATITMGTSPKGNTYNHEGTGLPLLNGPTEFGPVHPTCTLFTTDSKRECKKGDLIFCVRGSTTGRMNWADQVYSLGRGVCSIRGETTLDTKYIKYCLDYKLEALLMRAGGGTFPNLTKGDILTFPIPYPPHRRKIATVLSAYDDLIENNTRRITILEEMAQLLYREWFVHFRFPGHEGVAMVDSELGPIPEGWKVVKLGAIADINASSIRKDTAPERINYVNISSVSTGRIEEIEPMAFKDAPSRARRIVKHGDIIWSTVRPNRKSYCLILDPVSNMIVSTGFAVITARKVPYTYLYHALTTDEFVAYLTNNATGAAYPAVNAGDFKNADVLLPPSRLLESFHTIVVDFFDEKQNLHRKNDVLRRTRDLLLPRLISGEVGVSDLPIAAGGLDIT